jgi:prepilin-type N-terminal cleavage/methylation domain-containing protein
MANKSLLNQRGFSLAEVLVVIFAFSFAIATLGNFILTSYRAYNYNFQQIAAINEARRGIEIMVKEIREAKTGDDGSYPLVQAGDLQFIFYSDIDLDAVTERVRYFLDGSNLKKGVIKSSGDPPIYDLSGETISILSQYVRNAASSPIFTYYNGDWPADTINNPLPTLTRLSETKLMHVYLKINVDPNRPPDNFELESDTQIRNLKTNL